MHSAAGTSSVLSHQVDTAESSLTESQLIPAEILTKDTDTDSDYWYSYCNCTGETKLSTYLLWFRFQINCRMLLVGVYDTCSYETRKYR